MAKLGSKFFYINLLKIAKDFCNFAKVQNMAKSGPTDL